jgi:hypothetical protein
MFPVPLLMNIAVGFLFTRHLLHAVVAVMKAIPAAVADFRLHTTMVLTASFVEPVLDFAVGAMLAWFFYNCCMFSQGGGLDKVVQEGSAPEAKQFMTNNEILLSHGDRNSMQRKTLAARFKEQEENENVSFKAEDEDLSSKDAREKNLNYT